MPVPRFRSVAAAFASRRFEEVGSRSAEAPRVAVPRVRRKAGAFRLPPRPVRSGRERPLLAAWRPLGKTELPGNECLRSPPIRASPIAFPQGHAAIERRTSRSCRTLFASFKSKRTPILPPAGPSMRSELPVSTRLQPRTEASSDPSAAGSSTWKRTPRLDPFAAWAQGEPRSFRCRMSHEKRTPRPRSFAAPARSKLRFLAAGPCAEARTLQHPARSRHRPKANLLPFAARSSARGQALEPRPFAARAGASPVPDRRTA